MGAKNDQTFVRSFQLGKTASADELEFFFRLFMTLMHKHGKRGGVLGAESVMGPYRLELPGDQQWLHCRSLADLATYGSHPIFDISVGETPDVGERDAEVIRLSFGWRYPGPTLECRVWQPTLEQGWGNETPAVWELIDFLHLTIAACGSDMRVLRKRSWVARALNRLSYYCRVPRPLR